MLLLSLLRGPYRFPGFCGNQRIRVPTRSQNPFLNRLRNGSKSCFLLVSGASQHFMFLFLSFAFIFLSCCTSFLSCSFHVPFMFLSFVFKFCSFHTPFICIHVLSSSFHLPLVFLPSSFHLPFIFLSSSDHLPFNLHACSFHLASCPFICFLKLWKWFQGLARGLSATNG